MNEILEQIAKEIAEDRTSSKLLQQIFEEMLSH
jgi:hypothetical protein